MALVAAEAWLLPQERLLALMREASAAAMLPSSGLPPVGWAKLDAELGAWKGGRHSEQEDDEDPYEIRDGVAQIQISGVLAKRRMWWTDSTSTVEARNQIAHAVANPRVSAIMLQVASPGGTVSGTQELVDAIRSARDSKPVRAHIADIGASAAYWIAAQAERISAGPTALVGSIGVIATVLDASKAFDDFGLKMHVVRSAPAKGGPQLGEPVSADQLASVQTIVDETARLFADGVRRSRGLTDEQLARVTTGDVWLSRAALELGLIDALSTADGAHKAFAPSPIQRFARALGFGGTQTMPNVETKKKSLWARIIGEPRADGSVQLEVTEPEPPAAAEPKVEARAPAPDPEFVKLRETMEAQTRLMAQQSEQLARVQKDLDAAKAAARLKNFEEDAKSLLSMLPGTHAEHASTLEAVAGLPAEQAERVRQALAQANRVVGESSIFKEIGAGFGDTLEASDTDMRIGAAARKVAAEAEAKGKPMHPVRARVAVLKDDPALFRAALLENDGHLGGPKRRR